MAKRNLANVFNAPKSNSNFSEGNKSKGILDDHAVRGNIATKEGTIEHVPTEDNHIINLKYITDLNLPTTYLKLDCSNDPLTENLELDKDITVNGVTYTKNQIVDGTITVEKDDVSPLMVTQQDFANAHRLGTSGSANELATAVIKSIEGRLHFIAENSGSAGAIVALSMAPSSGANKHWVIHHRGPNQSNKFSIGYKTSLGNGWDPVSAIDYFNIQTTGTVVHQRATILNDNGGNYDTQIKGDTDVNLIYVDASTDRVGIGTATPTKKFEIVGDARIEGTSNAGSNLFDCTQKGTGRAGYFYRNVANGARNVLSVIQDNAASGTLAAMKITQKDTDEIALEIDDGSTSNMVIMANGDTGIGTTTPDTKLQVVGDTKLGDDNTNYASFATDGELTLTGTARVNKEFNVPLTDFNPGASGPTKALHDIFPTFEFNIGDDMHTSFEMPDDWATGTDLTVEVYWAIDEAYATNSGEVRWNADWRAVAVGELISGGSSGTMDFGDINIHATANTIVKTESTISGASLTADDLVAFNGSRVALVAGNNPTAEPYIVAVRVEYIADKLGEAT